MINTKLAPEGHPLLVYQTQTSIQTAIVYKNKTVSITKNIYNIKPNIKLTFEISHRNHSLCFVSRNGSNKMEPFKFKCLSIDDFSVEWEMTNPDFFSSISCKFFFKYLFM